MRAKRVFPLRRHSAAQHRQTSRANAWLVAAGLALTQCARGSTPSPLECVVDYGGESHKEVVHPTNDPYRVPSLKLEEAFEFKAVYVAAPPAVAALNFYVYAVTEHGPVMVEQTKYLPPFPRNAPSLNGNFTGAHHVYGPDGEELVYSCRWRSQ
jgi:hypothetical protein